MNVQAIITGARGIGGGIAKYLASKGGCTVNVLCRSEQSKERLQEELDQCSTISEIHNVHVCDVRDATAVSSVVNKVAQQGPITNVVNAAGINHDALLLRASPGMVADMMEVNLVGTINVTKACVKHMMRSSPKLDTHSTIVNLSSAVAYHGRSGQSIYAASKAGIVGFSQSLALELASRNITVNTIAPGFIDTDMTASLEKEELLKLIPQRRFGTIQEIVEAFKMVQRCGYMTGSVLHVDGGLSA
eukprot:m.38587 g.38587  ORF g.38587 m.38587 type:complete len:246 (-) comp10206_c0_seq2:6644-7381(-)